MGNKFKLYIKLFYTSFIISFSIIGGGQVAIPIIKRTFVEKEKWLDEDEMLDMLAVAQATPGAIAVNLPVLVGKKLGGFLGSVSMVLGIVIPPLCLMLIIQKLYTDYIDNQIIINLFKGMNCAVAAMMIDITLYMGKATIKKNRLLSPILITTSFLVLFFFNVNAGYLIGASIIIGLIIAFIENNKEGKNNGTN